MEKRSPNFTSTEVDYLLDAVKKYSDIIESKKTDRVGAEEKINAWRSIEREFNSKYPHTFRSHKVLKTKYGNIKATAKQNFGTDKRQTYATGGGPLQQSVTTKTDHAILEICQETQILGKSSVYDCDANENELTDEIIVQDDVAGSEKLEEKGSEVKNENNVDVSWAKYTPKMLKMPMNKKLKRKDSTKDSWAKVAEAKIERQTLEIEMLKEKHSLEMEKLRLEIDILKIQMERLQRE